MSKIASYIIVKSGLQLNVVLSLSLQIMAKSLKLEHGKFRDFVSQLSISIIFVRRLSIFLSIYPIFNIHQIQILKVAFDLQRLNVWCMLWKGVCFLFCVLLEAFWIDKEVFDYSSVSHRKSVVRVESALAWPSMVGVFVQSLPPLGITVWLTTIFGIFQSS